MTLSAPKVPCGTCPYRLDVPPGIWHPDEYAKLPLYDGPTFAQAPEIFMCHQRDGNLCGGWLACHGPMELLALRLVGAVGEGVDPSVWYYETAVPVFESGAEAAAHGLSAIEEPPPEAVRKINGLMKQRQNRENDNGEP